MALSAAFAAHPRRALPRRERVLRTRAEAEAGGKAPVAYAAPEPKTFQVRPDKLLDTATAAAGFVFRGTSGALVAGYNLSLVADDAQPAVYGLRATGRRAVETSTVLSAWKRPVEPLVVYEFQGCPFCKRVREAATYFDIDGAISGGQSYLFLFNDRTLAVLVYPCPRDGPTYRRLFRNALSVVGSKEQFPYLHDPNTGARMYESADIIKYMADTYADGVVPPALSSSYAPLLLGLALLPRLGRGGKYRASKANDETKPLILWAYEASPFCVLVREVLTELELPHIIRSCARGSPKRQQLFEQEGLFQAPFLEDPNTGVRTFESASIIEYLEAEYAV